MELAPILSQNPHLRVILDECPRAAAENMAIDEALFRSVAIPVLRFYSWSRPAISIGYFQPIADILAVDPSKACVRRWTGGGMVFHGADLTYSLVIPAAVETNLAPQTPA